MNIDLEKLANLFNYHRPDADRAKKHKEWNDLVVKFVCDSTNYIENEDEFLIFLNQMQQIRMLGNQTITNVALNFNYRDIFTTEEE